ncbi:hypothetical protein PAMP_014521 [Pampus punctatissimus]
MLLKCVVAGTTAPVTATSAEAEKHKKNKILSLWKRVFGRPQRKCSVVPAPSTPMKKEKKNSMSSNPPAYEELNEQDAVTPFSMLDIDEDEDEEFFGQMQINGDNLVLSHYSSLNEQWLVHMLLENEDLNSTFLKIRDAHSSMDIVNKLSLLCSFKEAVSAQAPEFMDHRQKDAHEFLTSILEQIRSLSLELQENAVKMSLQYTCPVENHLMFQMENTRTCRGVLILHIKRFRFTHSYNVEKVRDPVTLFRELVVSSKEGGGCYSLVSIINHFGNTANTGHYVCDSVHPDESPDDTTDRWLTFNDSVVTETTGHSVCQQRKNAAYILFYKQQNTVYDGETLQKKDSDHTRVQKTVVITTQKKLQKEESPSVLSACRR